MAKLIYEDDEGKKVIMDFDKETIINLRSVGVDPLAEVLNLVIRMPNICKQERIIN